MSSRLNCPNGHILGITPAMEGKKIKCPKCQAILEVPIMTAVESTPPKPPPLPGGIQKGPPARDRSRWDEDEEEDDRPRSRSRAEADDDEEPRSRQRDNRNRNDEEDDDRAGKAKQKLRRRQMRATRLGLLLFYWKFILYLAAIFAHIVNSILTTVFGAMAGAAAQRGDRGGIESASAMAFLVILIYGFAMLATFVIAPVLGIIGGSFIARVPSKSGARGLALATLVLEAVPVGCGILALLNGALSFRNPEAALLTLVFILLAVLAMLAAFILFMLFLRQVAYFLKDRGTAKEAVSLMIAYLITTIAGPFVIGISTFFLARLMCIGAIILLIMVIGWIVLMIKQLFGILGVIAIVRARI